MTLPYLSAVLLLLPLIVITQMMLDLCVKVCLKHLYIKCFILSVVVAPCVEGTLELRSLYSGDLSSTTSGLVTICVNGVRNLICDSNWDFASARVTCDSLGYSPIG